MIILTLNKLFRFSTIIKYQKKISNLYKIEIHFKIYHMLIVKNYEIEKYHQLFLIENLEN